MQLLTFSIAVVFRFHFLHLPQHFLGGNKTLSYGIVTFVAYEASLEILSSYLSLSFSLNEVSLALDCADIFLSELNHVYVFGKLPTIFPSPSHILPSPMTPSSSEMKLKL